MRIGTQTQRCAVVLLLSAGILGAGLMQQGVLAQSSMVLVGAGSGLPEALYVSLNGEYSRENGTTHVRYLPLGTEEGSHQVQKGVADFGGGDYPLTAQQQVGDRGKLIQIPVAGVGIAIIYNVPGLQQEIRLNGPVLADIFLAKITNWNHPEIAKLNSGVHLPNLGIMVLHRSEGKGANYIFTEYLSRVSPEFKSRVGKGLSPRWVTGTSLARGEDILFQVGDTEGAIGYVEMDLALKSKMSIARLRNLDGEFVAPNPFSVGAALAKADFGEDWRGSVTNAPGRESYPIAGVTWLYIPQSGKDLQRQQAAKKYVLWILTSGQISLAKFGYAPLPANTAARAKAQLDRTG